MADDLPPLLSLEPIGGPGARSLFDIRTLDPELFAVAWFIAGGDDASAANLVDTVHSLFAHSYHGAGDARSYAFLLLVPRAWRTARRARGRPVGDRAIDAIFATKPQARAAIVLRCGLGLDDAAAGQLLGVDAYECASLQRHALGAASFRGVPEAVQAIFDTQVDRVTRDGLPAASKRQARGRRGVLGVTAAVLAALVATIAWHAHDTGTATAARRTVLDAPGWSLNGPVTYEGSGSEEIRVYSTTGENGLPLASVLLGGASVAADDGTRWTTVNGRAIGERSSIDDWRKFVVRADCATTSARSFGYGDEALRAALSTLRCASYGAPRIEGPPGSREQVVRRPVNAGARRLRYTNGLATVVMYASPAYVMPETLAGPGARLVIRGTRRIVVDATAHDDGSTSPPAITMLVGRSLVRLTAYGIDEATLLEIATAVHEIDGER